MGFEILCSAASRVHDLDEAIWSVYDKAKVKTDWLERKRVDRLRGELGIDIEEALRSAHSLATILGRQREGKRTTFKEQRGNKKPGKVSEKSKDAEAPKP